MKVMEGNILSNVYSLKDEILNLMGAVIKSLQNDKKNLARNVSNWGDFVRIMNLTIMLWHSLVIIITLFQPSDIPDPVSDNFLEFIFHFQLTDSSKKTKPTAPSNNTLLIFKHYLTVNIRLNINVKHNYQLF